MEGKRAKAATEEQTLRSRHEQEEMGRARLEYLYALQSVVEHGTDTSVVLQDASEPLYANRISAFAADGSACVVQKLRTVLGELEGAIIRTDDILYVSARIKKQVADARPPFSAPQNA